MQTIRGVLPVLASIIWIGLMTIGCNPSGTDSSAGLKTGADQSLFSELEMLVPNLDPQDRAAAIDSFLGDADIPYISGNTAVFIHRGDFATVSVAGDMTNWDPNRAPMKRLADTDLWYREMVFEPTARLDYKLVINDTLWILDPRNPRQVPGGYGVNSELAMPGYVQPDEIVSRDDISHGAIVERAFPVASSGDSRTVKVYLPDGYTENGEYGLVLFHDGDDYLNLGAAKQVLDYLISSNRIRPIVAAFMTSPDRNEEYGFSQTDAYERLVVEDFIPWIKSEYAISEDPGLIATTGVSLGGLISTQLCYRNPNVFGLCGPVSPSYWAEDRMLMEEVLDGDRRDISFYIDWGTYEPSIAETGQEMRDGLVAKGYSVVWNEWHEGHSWGNWRAHLDEMLVAFFGVGRES